jgi:serine phosphatase RsbU (regulator of sigma subunit)
MDLYQQIFFTTLSVAFGLLHLMLFLYNRRLKSNLYFAIFLFFYALNIFFDFQEAMAPYGPTELVYLRIHRAVMPFNPIFALLFLYSIFNLKIAKQFWLIVAGLVITGIFAVIEPMDNFFYIQIFLLIFFIESIRIFYLSIYQKKDGALLIGVGFALLFLFSFYDLLMDLNVIQPFHNIENGYPFGFVCLIITISIYLSRDFARINNKIIAQEISAKEMEIAQRLLEAEDARKSKELEEARTLQLSMLPQCVPELNELDICFDMRTATEVGGDYYDYQVSDDGTVTLAIGDATGHGMKAGIMVSIIKSLFLISVAHSDIPAFFNKCSRVIKQMHLGNLFMAMMLVKINNRKMVASSAGMPPIFIYRAKTKSIDEFVIKGMPLGAFDSFSYQTIETQLDPGDTVLLMSDGFSELFNERDEIFDYFRIKKTFEEVTEMPSNEIVRHLFAVGEKWRNRRKQNDDITFVVFKIK